jgi:hypothetical protein
VAWLVALLTILAIHRLTRLAVADEIPVVKVPREKLQNWFDPLDGRLPPAGGRLRSIAYLLGCPWCMSIWIGAILVLVVCHVVSLPVPALVWLAASSVTGWAASAESEHEQRHTLRQRQIDGPEHA